MKKRIRTAVIGVGHLGRFHAQKYAGLDNAELVGIADSNTDNAKRVAEEVGTRAYFDYRELVGHVDAVSVVTPTESHLKIAADFLSRGIDVLVEKPIAMNTAEAKELVAVAKKSGAILQVGHLERFNGAVMALEGKIESPLFIESRRLSPFPNRSTDVDVILDLMIHDIDIILSLVNSDIESIDAVGIPVVTNSVDITNARLRFTNGCVADVTANRVSRVKERTINIYQPETNISIDYAAQHITITDITPDKEAGFAKLVDTELDIVKSDSLLEEIKAFLACSEHNRRPLVSGHEGLIALEVASRIQEAVANSMQRGRN